MQRLRAEYDVDASSPIGQRSAFLTRDAATDANHELRTLRFQLLPAAELVKHLLLRLLPDGAGIEQ